MGSISQRRLSSTDSPNKSICVYSGCRCKKEEIIELFQRHPNELKDYASKNCVQLSLVKKGAALYFEDGSCKINQVAKEVLFITRSHEKVFYVSMYTFLEERNRLTLAGEGGKITGRQSYWNDLAVHLSNNKDKSFFIYSFGGGQGNDAKAIQNFLVSKDFRVDGFKIVEINELAYHLSEHKDQFTVEDGYTFLTTLPPRDEHQVNIFHLGNFLSILRVDTTVEFLTLLASKMMQGDIISILVIRKDQFQNITILQKNEESENKGLAEFDKVSSDSRKFFRTTISDIEQFNDFIHSLGLTMMFEKIDEEIDDGPKRIKMLFVKVGGYKLK
jgi:hypothetical protein